MPTYEYQCAKGHQFELFQRISDKPKAKCPVCGAKASRIISGGAGLIFKGSGFYITDYGKDGKGPRKESDEAKAPAAEKPEATVPKPETTEKAAASAPAKKEKKARKAAE